METETIVLSGDGQTTQTTLKGRSSDVTKNKRRHCILRTGIGLLAIVFLSLVLMAVVWARAPRVHNTTSVAMKQDGTQEVTLTVLFSTSYVIDYQNSPLHVKNLDSITEQLNARLSEYQLRVIGASFYSHQTMKQNHQTTCENRLSGSILQLNLVIFYSHRCPSDRDDLCKTEAIKKLQDAFTRMSTISIIIQLDDERSVNVNLKICSLTGKTGTPIVKQGHIAKQYGALLPMVTRATKKNRLNPVTRRKQPKNSRCSQSIGRILLVQMTGEHGSRIQDDVRAPGFSSGQQNRQQTMVTLYEDTTYRLHFEFDCSEERAKYQSEDTCDLSQNVNAWISLDGENAYDTRSLSSSSSRSNSYIRGNAYELDIQIPVIDGREIRSGVHRITVAVVPTEAYLRACGLSDFNDTREYTVNIVPKARYSGVANAPDAITLNEDLLCVQNTAQISLVLMAGERGTEIRDDQPTNVLLTDYANRHHLAVTLYEHTVYLLRIQLDCSWQLNRDLFENGCNLAQDVHVWIDADDNDRRFDQSEIGAPYRWPVTSYMAQGIYDMQISIPLINNRRVRTGQYRMRIVVAHTDNYRRICGRADYNETREYTVNIISRGGYLAAAEMTTPYMVLNDIVCSAHLNKIVLIVMAGEHRTQIRDDSFTRSALADGSRLPQQQTLVLFEDTVYLLRIQLDCSHLWTSNSLHHRCSLVYDVNAWIDLNDDGVFDSSENAALYHWPLTSYTPQGVYDLQLYIPIIDTTRIRRGPHRLQVVVTMNEQYRRKCDNNDYRELREYSVSIVPHTRHMVAADAPRLALKDVVCSQKNGKIALVLMAGEQGTHIRDNIPDNNALREDQNRHHLAVTLYENTVYRIRIQLDCFPHWKGGYPESDCNVIQDVDVSIDFNNDNRFDETESRVPHRSPLFSSMLLGIYDLFIEIPSVDGTTIKSGAHRMRIVAVPSEEYNRKCGTTSHRETREYTVNIISKNIERELRYQDGPDPRSDAVIGYELTYCPPGNLACAADQKTIALVHLYGEQGTEIQDTTSQCHSMNNYHDRSNLVVTLIDNTVYTLRIQLQCAQQWNDGNAYDQRALTGSTYCNHAQYLGVWIDLNNDGVFDENKERILPKNWYEDGQPVNQYDLSIAVVKLDGRSHMSEQHRMRIVLVHDERNRKPCYSSGHGEVRDYTVHVLPKSEH